MMRWIALAAVLFALPAWGGSFTEVVPSFGKIVCYGDSLCNSRTGDWMKVFTDKGLQSGVAGVSGASADLASSATASLEAQVINAAGCPSAQVDVFGDGAIDTCVADMVWGANDLIIIQIGTNDVSAGAASAWDSGGNGATYQTALENVLTEIATTQAQCILLLPVPRGDLIDSDGAPDQAKYDLIPGAVRARQIAAVAAVSSDCQIVDTFTPFEAIRVEFGDDAMFELYTTGNVHPSSTPGARGRSGVSIVGNHVHDAALSAKGAAWSCNPFGSFGCEEWVQTAGFPTAGEPIDEDFNQTPEQNGWTDRLGTITWSPTFVTASSGVFNILTKDGSKASSNDVVCVIGGTAMNSGDDFMGCMRGIDEANYATSKHIGVWFGGGGLLDIYEMTGSTRDRNICALAELTNDNCGDAGNIDPDSCAGIQIIGEGTSLVVKTWANSGDDIPCDIPFPSKTDIAGWGTCTAGAFGSTASSPGCTDDNCALATGVGCNGTGDTADPSGTFNDGDGIGLIFQRGADGNIERFWQANEG